MRACRILIDKNRSSGRVRTRQRRKSWKVWLMGPLCGYFRSLPGCNNIPHHKDKQHPLPLTPFCPFLVHHRFIIPAVVVSIVITGFSHKFSYYKRPFFPARFFSPFQVSCFVIGSVISISGLRKGSVCLAGWLIRCLEIYFSPSPRVLIRTKAHMVSFLLRHLGPEFYLLEGGRRGYRSFLECSYVLAQRYVNLTLMLSIRNLSHHC